MSAKLLNSIIIISFLCTLFSISYAQRLGPRGHYIDKKNNFSACLNLNFEQTEKIREINLKYENDVSILRFQLFERNTELRLMWMQLKPDEKKIKLKLKEIHDLKLKIKERETDYWLAYRALLTPKQLSQFLASGGFEKLKFHGEPPQRFQRKPPPF